MKSCMFLFCFYSWMTVWSDTKFFQNFEVSPLPSSFNCCFQEGWSQSDSRSFLCDLLYMSLPHPTPEVCRNFSVAPVFRIPRWCPLECVYFHLLCWTLPIWKLRSLPTSRKFFWIASLMISPLCFFCSIFLECLLLFYWTFWTSPLI